MRRFIKALAAALALTAPLYANALPITWTYAGVCTQGDCGALGAITGTIVGDPTRWGPSNQLNEYVLFGDLVSYSFNIGGSIFSGTRGEGAYQLDGAGNIIGGSMSFDNFLAFDFLDVGSASWSVFDTRCAFIFCTFKEASGTGRFTTSTPVPEPTSLALFGLGVLGLGLMRRRRAR